MFTIWQVSTLITWYDGSGMSTPPPETYIFEVKDWRGRIVRLTSRTFKTHEQRHPEFPQYIEAAKQTIQDPDFVAEADNGALYLVRFRLGRKPFENLYLVVVVYYKGAEGVEVPYHFARSLKDVRVVEIRYQWLAGNRFAVGSIAKPRVDQ